MYPGSGHELEITLIIISCVAAFSFGGLVALSYSFYNYVKANNKRIIYIEENLFKYLKEIREVYFIIPRVNAASGKITRLQHRVKNLENITKAVRSRTHSDED